MLPETRNQRMCCVLTFFTLPFALLFCPGYMPKEPEAVYSKITDITGYRFFKCASFLKKYSR